MPGSNCLRSTFTLKALSGADFSCTSRATELRMGDSYLKGFSLQPCNAPMMATSSYFSVPANAAIPPAVNKSGNCTWSTEGGYAETAETSPTWRVGSTIAVKTAYYGIQTCSRLRYRATTYDNGFSVSERGHRD